MKYFAANYNCVIDRMERISVKFDTYNEAVEWIAANGPRNCDGDSIAMVSHDYYETTDYPVSDTVVDVVETVVEAVRPHEMTNVVYQTCCLVNQTMTIPEAPYKHGRRVRSERHITLYTKALARLREDSAPQNDIDNCVAFLEFECNI